MHVQPWNTLLQLVLLFPHRSLSAFAFTLLKKKKQKNPELPFFLKQKGCLFLPPCFHNSKNGNGFCFSFPNKKKSLQAQWATTVKTRADFSRAIPLFSSYLRLSFQPAACRHPLLAYLENYYLAQKLCVHISTRSIKDNWSCIPNLLPTLTCFHLSHYPEISVSEQRVVIVKTQNKPRRSKGLLPALGKKQGSRDVENSPRPQTTTQIHPRQVRLCRAEDASEDSLLHSSLLDRDTSKALSCTMVHIWNPSRDQIKKRLHY